MAETWPTKRGEGMTDGLHDLLVKMCHKRNVKIMQLTEAIRAALPLIPAGAERQKWLKMDGVNEALYPRMWIAEQQDSTRGGERGE